MQVNAGNKSSPLWEAIGRSITRSRAINSNGRIESAILEEALAKMEPSDFILLHIPRQNAAVYIYFPSE
jgi:hypothetical protein